MPSKRSASADGAGDGSPPPSTAADGAAAPASAASEEAAPSPPRTRRPKGAAGSAATSAPIGVMADASPASGPALAGIVVAPEDEADGGWVEADALEVSQGAIGRVSATEVSVTQGAIGAARADQVAVQMGALGAAMGREISLERSAAGTLLAQSAVVEQSVVRTLVAREVEFRKPSAVLVLLAQRVGGDVRVLLDWRGALAFGAAFGVIAGLLGRGRRRR